MIQTVLLAAGLLTGSIHVQVQFASLPASIEILLDGQEVAQLTSSPWESWVELGDELKPRKLEVISRDSAGGELDRQVRWLNLSTPTRGNQEDETPVTVVLDHPDQVPPGIGSWFEVDGRDVEVVAVENPGAELWIVRDPRVQRQLEQAGR